MANARARKRASERRDKRVKSHQFRIGISGWTHAGWRLPAWARRIRRWRRAVYVYFDNDRKVQAPIDAIRLAEHLGLGFVQQTRKSA